MKIHQNAEILQYVNYISRDGHRPSLDLIDRLPNIMHPPLHRTVLIQSKFLIDTRMHDTQAKILV